VLSKNFSAEYSGIANVRIETKRGSNQYHGSLFYNNKNSALAAWVTQDKVAKANFLPTTALPKYPEPYFNLNETGGSFGGPVPLAGKNTFFLLSYERRWDLSPVQLRSNTIPTSRILGGDFTSIAAGSRPLVPAAVKPLLTPSEIANNTTGTGATQRFISIPTRLLNPIALNILNAYYPKSSPDAPFSATTGRLIDFVQTFSGLLTRDLATMRVDHDFSDKDKFYGVYNFQSRFSCQPTPCLWQTFAAPGESHAFSLLYAAILRPCGE
jgi:hypothetical protein